MGFVSLFIAAVGWGALQVTPVASGVAVGTAVHLDTEDTAIIVVPGMAAPELAHLEGHQSPPWINRASEGLIPWIEEGGVRKTLAWKYDAAASQASLNQIDFIYESAGPPLRLTWEWRKRADFGPLEHRIMIQNLGAQEILLPLQDSLDFNWHRGPTEKLQQAYIDKGAGRPTEVGTHEIPLLPGYSWSGQSSSYAQDNTTEIIPWFRVQRSDAASDGWYVGVEFSGRVQLSLSRSEDSLQGRVGLNPNPAGAYRTRLAPGATFETPTVFLGACAGGADGAGNVLHRWVRQVMGNPRTWADPHFPLLDNNSWGGGMQVTDAVARRMIEQASQLGLEMFHVDAGWFRGVGDWYPDPTKFPAGLATIADDAHAHGLKLGLWVDWTQAGTSSQPGALSVHDPRMRDWLTRDVAADWKPGDFTGQTIDLGEPAAAAWAQRETNRIVRDYHLDMLEHDGYLVAKNCDRDDHPHAAPMPSEIDLTMPRDLSEKSNSTEVDYHAARAYYAIQDELRREHPSLLLEMCNDGGRMVDFGSAAHGDYFSITDSYDPLSNRRAFYDASYVLPPAMLECYEENTPTPTLESFRSMLRSGMMGWCTIMLDTTRWTPEAHAAAKAEFTTYKTKLRPLIRDADLYHVSPRPDGVHWDGVEYVDRQQKRGVVYAFRGTGANESSHVFLLHGLRADAAYRLHFQDGSSPDRTAAGADLVHHGLRVDLAQPTSSELIFFESIAAQ